MVTTSETYQTKIRAPTRTFITRITIADTVYTDSDICAIEFGEYSLSSEGYTIGAVPSKSVEITVLNEKGKVYSTSAVKVEIGLDLGHTVEYIPIGMFNIDELESTKQTTTITCYDNMIRFETPYFSDIENPTIKQIVAELEELTGVTFTGSLPNYTVTNPVGYTCREVLGYVAAVCAGNALITRDGKFTIVQPKNSGQSFTAANAIEFSFEDTVYKIGKITCQNGDNSTISSGALTVDSVELTIENPLMTQAILDTVYNTLKQISYTGYSIKWQGDPSIDLGDILTFTNTDGTQWMLPILSETVTYNRGMNAEIAAKGQTKNKNSFQSSGEAKNQIDRMVIKQALIEEALIEKASIKDLEATNIKVQTITGEFAEFKNLTTENFSSVNATIQTLSTGKADVADLAAINADIDNLKVGKADITALNAAVADIGSIYASLADINTALIGKANVVDLNATNANINNLTADIATINEALIGKASITDLQAAVADIGELTAGVADINTLLAGNVAAGSTQTIVLNAENTTIDQALIKNVIAKHISVADLVAGDINTTKFRVTSESGRLIISDNTMQIKDAKRVRVQVGKDASGDYTLAVWDSSGNLMWDARGAKAAAIKDKIIRDDMVSDDANIAGSKINLPSLITEINGQTQTIKSSLIAYDPTGQTLDVMMSQMTTDISGNTNNIATLSTQLSVEQGKIATLITESTQTKDDLTTLTDKYNSTVATVDGLSITLGAVESKITNLRVGGVNRALRTATPYVRTAWSNKSNDTKQIYTVASDIDGQSIVLSFDLTLTDIVTGTGGTPRIGWQVHDTKNYPYSTYITNLADGTQHIVIKGNAYKWTYPLGIVIQIRGDYIVSGTATMSNLRLVTGDVEADWSPAPEDTDSALDTMSNTIQSVSDNQASINVAINGFYSRFSANEETISTHTEQISTATQTAESAKSTATTAKTTADAAKTAATNAANTANTAKSTADAAKTAADTATSKVTTLTTEVQTAKSQVSAMEQTLDSFGVRLGNTETSITTVTERVENLQVGGINLIQNSEFKTGKKKWNLCNGKGTVDTDTTYRGRNSIKIVGAGSTIADRLNPLAAYYAPYTPGESLVFKVWVMCPDVTKVTGNFQAYIAYRKEGNEPNGATFTSVSPADFAAAGNNTWFAVTVNSKSAVPENVWCTAFVAPNNSDATFYVSSPKLEYGTMATDWSPAPEDTDDAIETVKDSVKTVSDKQASMELTLNSFGTRLSSAESTVTTHTEQISTATETANSAKSTATTAKTTADAAKTAADSAKSTANTAKSTADAAKTAADTATSKVTTLTTEVQTAKNQVSEMSQTLNSFSVRLSDTESSVTKVTERVENLQVGGRNHVRNGDFNITKLSRWWVHGNVTLSLVDGTLQAVATVAGVSGKHDFYTRIVAFDTDSVTISFDAKASAAMDFYVRGHAEAINGDAKKVSITTDWARYSVTYVIKNASKNDTFVFWPGSAGTVWLDNVKVEAGNVATDFTLAPEDTDDAIETVKDSVKTVSDKQASMELTLNSFGTRLSSTESTVSTHTEQISTATETAESAKSTATTAKTTADAAKTAATNAANTANTAKSTADAAKTAADTATSKVTTLTTEVTTAKNQVSAMEQTLDSFGVRLSDTETNITTVTERVENLQIGSVNRALKTATPYVRTSWTRVSSGTTVRENVVTDMYSVASDIDGQKTVLSFDITFDGVTPSSEASDIRVPHIYIQFTDGRDWPFQFRIDDLSDRTVHFVKKYDAFTWKNPPALKLRLRSDYIADGSRITISNLRLVAGDKEADWSPAPEDTSSAIETVKESVKTVSDKQAQLTVDLNGITGRVTSVESTTQEHTTQLSTVDSRIKTAKDAAISSAASTAQSKADAAKTAAINAAKGYTDGQLTTVNETLSTHTSEISALQGAINLKVEQTDIDNTLANIKYGGNNLLQDSDFPTGTKKWNLCNGKASVDTTTQFRGRNSIKIVGASNATNERLNPLQAYYSVHTPGETLTLRVWLMCPDVTKIANNVLVYIAYRNADGDAVGNHELRVPPADFTAAGNNKWFAVVITGKTDKAGCVRSTMIVSPNNPNATIYVSSPKLEYGTVPTDWSPAPTDLQVYADKAVSALQASIKITTDNITSSVTDLQSRTTTVEGKVQEQETRLKAAEQKITADAIISTVSSSYYKKAQTDSLISSAKSAAATDAQNKADAAKTAAINAANANTAKLLLSYSTTQEMNSAIEQKADSIVSTVNYTSSESVANVLGNKVINGNFGSGLTGWTSFPSAQYSVVTEDERKAVSLFKNSSSECGVKQTISNLQAGKYILSFYFKGVADLSYSASGLSGTDEATDADVWQEFSGTVSHTSGSCTVKITIVSGSGCLAGVHLLPLVSSNFESVYSKIDQQVNSITQTVSQTYATKSDLNAATNRINTAESQIEQLATQITSKVSVNELGTAITQNAEYVRLAWNQYTQIIQFENASLSVYNSASADKKLLMRLNQRGQQFYKDGTLSCELASTQWSGLPNTSGIFFALPYGTSAGNYMAWAKKDSTDSNYNVRLVYHDGVIESEGLYVHTPLRLRNNMYADGYEIQFQYGNRLKSWGGAGTGYAIAPAAHFSIATIKTGGDDTLIQVDDGSISFHRTLNMNGFAITNQSDARLKTNIADTEISGLDVINALSVKQFDWIESGEHVDAGLIAQQVKQVAPELVGMDDNGVYNLNKLDLIMYLIKAVQELSEQVGVTTSAALKARGFDLSTLRITDKNTLVKKLQNKRRLMGATPEPEVVYLPNK